MQVQIEDVGPCKKTLRIEIPPDKVREKLDESYLELGQQVEIPGFRKGHAPRKLMEKRFGDTVNKDVHAALISESLEEAMKEHSLKVIGRPDLPEAQGDFSLEEPLTFEVTLEVRPQIELPDFSQFTLTRPSTEVTGEDIDKGIQRLQRRDATYAPVKDAEVQDDDMVIADVSVTSDGSAVDHVEDASLRPVLRNVIGIPCDDLPAILNGAKTGDTRTATVTLPENHRNEEFAGKEVEVAIKITGIKRLELPEVTEEWAAKMRFETLDDLRDAIRDTIAHEKTRRAEDALATQMIDRLVETTPFDVPQGLLNDLVEGSVRRERLQLQMRNVPENEIEEILAANRTKAEGDAERECREFFLTEAVADKRHLFATEDEIRQRVAQMAANYGRSFEAMRAEMERDGSLDDIRSMMRREKTIRYMLDKATIADEGTDAPTQEAEEAGDNGNDKDEPDS